MILKSSVGDVGEQRHVAGSLDRDGELTLMQSTGPVDPSREDLASLARAVAKAGDVLEVDMLDLIGAETADLSVSLIPALTDGLLLRLSLRRLGLWGLSLLIVIHLTKPPVE